MGYPPLAALKRHIESISIEFSRPQNLIMANFDALSRIFNKIFVYFCYRLIIQVMLKYELSFELNGDTLIILVYKYTSSVSSSVLHPRNLGIGWGNTIM